MNRRAVSFKNIFLIHMNSAVFTGPLIMAQFSIFFMLRTQLLLVISHGIFFYLPLQGMGSTNDGKRERLFHWKSLAFSPIFLYQHNR